MDTDSLFIALDDDTARSILARTSERAYSARELADDLDVSPSTIYRQLETLTGTDLVIEETRIDPNGNHHHVYRTDVARIEIEVREESLETAVERREDPADRFTYLWERIRE